MGSFHLQEQKTSHKIGGKVQQSVKLVVIMIIKIIMVVVMGCQACNWWWLKKEDKQVDDDGNVTVGDGDGDDVETYFLF